MPNKTLSVREEDLVLWERAERAAKAERSSVSSLVASALADRLGHIDTCRVVMYEQATPCRIEAFAGRWLTEAPPAEVADYDDLGRGGGKDDDWHTFVAETARGRIAVYCCFHYSSYEKPPTLAVFDDLDTAMKALANNKRVDGDALIQAGTALGRNGKRGEEVRWRDI